MKRLARSIRKKYRYFVDAKTVTIDGVTLISDRDRIPLYLRDLMYREVYEDTERNILLKILKRGHKVVELGTGLGFISLLAARICGSENVNTYEANPAIESLIRENFRLNNIEPQLHMRAVTRDGRKLSFNAADNIISSSSFERGVSGRTLDVDSEAFSEVLRAHSPDVLIMDVEGGEYELLMSDNLGPIEHILVELHPHIIGREKVNEIRSHLGAKGFAVESNDRKTFHFHKIRPT
ncbi:FkbM family methyltransferase [Sinorhizobium kostiense]|uniref:FkbM family methyltransferase n=1 Tax=Sinorhizobium kostiense TaxID=76747 RepID=A0ABS4R5I5_9HYPH|nr:FkbM family methyltransferase [Sinorhizobium kostiense]MBP2237137.1 FkbM family methyltransferase [Sinorhizobium kostiense]